ncbi:hypothetical protein GCM10027418_21210 [Mariniluteicoccus endophyticus]
MADQGQSRSRQQIESDLTAARTRLAANLESLIDQVHPTNVKQRQVDGMKTLVNNELGHAKDQFKTADGQWRTDRLALVAGSVAGAVALLVTIRLITKKRS